MDTHKEKLEKVVTEPIPQEKVREEKAELHEVAKKAAKAEKKSGSVEKDELDDVEKIPKGQAQKEIKDAVQHVKKDEKRNSVRIGKS
ncbi:hypothetical protein [Dictyobacter arantiisoli]|uniref:Uncharacterized protein n=1 Tax=Dictyobacter arantiisoli TaxID=2014874 RepID=A0A5A5THS5_9CHLR|nr:hypothetical protein [Dictyobacter arantiisoli]GCF10524.1 hypothetical protein KDI_40880 [Dictyobacter arantiisoli]